MLVRNDDAVIKGLSSVCSATNFLAFGICLDSPALEHIILGWQAILKDKDMRNSCLIVACGSSYLACHLLASQELICV